MDDAGKQNPDDVSFAGLLYSYRDKAQVLGMEYASHKADPNKNMFQYQAMPAWKRSAKENGFEEE